MAKLHVQYEQETPDGKIHEVSLASYKDMTEVELHTETLLRFLPRKFIVENGRNEYETDDLICDLASGEYCLRPDGECWCEFIDDLNQNGSACTEIILMGKYSNYLMKITGVVDEDDSEESSSSEPVEDDDFNHQYANNPEDQISDDDEVTIWSLAKSETPLEKKQRLKELNKSLDLWITFEWESSNHHYQSFSSNYYQSGPTYEQSGTQRLGSIYDDDDYDTGYNDYGSGYNDYGSGYGAGYGSGYADAGSIYGSGYAGSNYGSGYAGSNYGSGYAGSANSGFGSTSGTYGGYNQTGYNYVNQTVVELSFEEEFDNDLGVCETGGPVWPEDLLPEREKIKLYEIAKQTGQTDAQIEAEQKKKRTLPVRKMSLKSKEYLTQAKFEFECRFLPQQFKVKYQKDEYKTRESLRCQKQYGPLINCVSCPKNDICWCRLIDRLPVKNYEPQDSDKTDTGVKLPIPKIRIPLLKDSWGNPRSGYWMVIEAVVNEKSDGTEKVPPAPEKLKLKVSFDYIYNGGHFYQDPNRVPKNPDDPYDEYVNF